MIVTDTPENFEIEKKQANSRPTKVKQVKKRLGFEVAENRPKSCNPKRPAWKNKWQADQSNEDEASLHTQNLLAAEFSNSSDISKEDFEDMNIDFVDKPPEERLCPYWNWTNKGK